MLDAGADVNKVHPEWHPVLFAVLSNCRADWCDPVVELLVQNGADVNMRNGGGS